MSWRLRAPALAFTSCPPDQNPEGEMQAAESGAEENVSESGRQRECADPEQCECEAHDTDETDGLGARRRDPASVEQQPDSRDHVGRAVPPQRNSDDGAGGERRGEAEQEAPRRSAVERAARAHGLVRHERAAAEECRDAGAEPYVEP